MELELERIDAVWRALRGRTPKSTSFPRSVEDRMVESRWVLDTELEDILFALDRRLDPPAVIDAAELASKLGLSYRFVYSRPRSRNDDVWAFGDWRQSMLLHFAYFLNASASASIYRPCARACEIICRTGRI